MDAKPRGAVRTLFFLNEIRGNSEYGKEGIQM
jgi:hypothetical protein